MNYFERREQMRNRKRIVFISSLLLISLLLSATNSIAVPVLKGPIRFTPEEPKPLDTIKFSGDIDFFSYAKGVYLVLDEFKDNETLGETQNQSMDHMGDGLFEKSCQLMYSDATKIKYQFVINVQDYPGVKWTMSDLFTLDLNLSGIDDGDDGSGDGDDDGTDDDTGDGNETDDGGSGKSSKSPGFELIFLVISLGIILYFKRKKNH